MRPRRSFSADYGFGLTGRGDLVSAAGALLHYVGTTLHHSLGHVRKAARKPRRRLSELPGQMTFF